VTQRNDDDAEALQDSLRKDDRVRDALTKAGEFLARPSIVKALSAYRGHVYELRSDIDLAIIEYDRKQREEQTQSP